MAREVLGVAGAAVGYYFGGPTGAQVGYMVGSTIGGVIDPVVIDGPQLGDASVQTSRDGVPISIGWGIWHVVGNIIQINDPIDTTTESGGKGGGPVTTENRRTQTFAIGIGRGPYGPIPGLRRVWENNKLIYDVREGSDFPAADNQVFLDSTNLYLGTEDQLADPELEAYTGVGVTPEYHGLAYIVFVDKDITDFGLSIPSYRFEILPDCQEIVTKQYFLGMNQTHLQYCSFTPEDRTMEVIAEFPRTTEYNLTGLACDGKTIIVPDALDAAPNAEVNDVRVIQWDGDDLFQVTETKDVDVNNLTSFFGHDGHWVAAGASDYGAGGNYGKWSESGITSNINFRWEYTWYALPHPGYYTLSPNDIPCRHAIDFNLSGSDSYGTTYVWGIAGASEDAHDNWVSSNTDVLDQSEIDIEQKAQFGVHVGTWESGGGDHAYSDSIGWDRYTGDFSVQYHDEGSSVFAIRRMKVSNSESLSIINTIEFDYGANASYPQGITTHTWRHGYLLISDNDKIYSFSIDGETPTLIDTLSVNDPLDVSLGDAENMHVSPFSDWIIVGELNGDGCAFQFYDDGTFNPDYCRAIQGADDPTCFTNSPNGIHFLDGPLEISVND